MANNRIFYACQAVAIAKTGHANADTPQFEVMKGVQSIGITTNFTLEQIFELGQVQLYSNEEQMAEVEITIEKVIDGQKLLYLQSVGEAGKTNIVSASNSKCDVYLAIFPDSTASMSGATRDHTLMCSGVVLSSVNYNYSVDGNATESVTLVGNNKFWDAGTYGVIGVSPNTAFGTAGGTTGFEINGTDVPQSGIVRRQKFSIVNSIIPPEVCAQGGPVANASGIQSISVSADFGRDDQMQLGTFGPYNKYAQFPFEITTEFEVNATNGDLVAISGNAPNTTSRQIVLRDLAGTVLNMGTLNKLTSVNYTGGDTGGGNATVTYSYSTYSDLKVDGGGTYWS
jgi:hypothetical protein